MDDWQTISLREANVALIDCEHRTPPSSASGFPYITIPQVKHGRIDVAHARRISREHFIEWTRKADPQPYDVVLSRRCNPGETAFVASGSKFALGQNLVLLRADGSKVYPPFLRWLVRGTDWWEQVAKFINVGAIFDSLKCADIPNLRLRIPSVPEQRLIAHILNSIDNKIELNRRKNETLEAMASAIFKSWFLRFDPVYAKLQARQPDGIDSSTTALFPSSFEDSYMGRIPRGFQAVRLESVLAEIETGSRPSGGIAAYSDGIPSIGAESIVGLARFDFAKTKFVPPEFYSQMSKGKLRSRDVLLYKDGGRPGLYEPHVAMFGDGFPFETACINEHVYRLRTRHVLSQGFLYFWLTSDLAMEEMRQKGTGVAIPGLNSTAVRSLSILLPTAEILRRFDRVSEPIIGASLANASESLTLTRLRDLLLPKLISGEIRLKMP